MGVIRVSELSIRDSTMGNSPAMSAYNAVLNSEVQSPFNKNKEIK